MAQRQRELEAAARAQGREQMGRAREAERARRAYERARAAEQKERQRLYLAARTAEAEAQNEALATRNVALEKLLLTTLSIDDYLDLESLKEEPEIPRFQPGALATSERAPELAGFLPPPVTGFAKLMPGAANKYQRSVDEVLRQHIRPVMEPT